MSNNGELSFELYKWLSSLQIINSGQKYKSNGNIQLDSKLYEELISGQLMGKLVEILAAELNVQLNGPLLSSIKKSNTPASRVYNWNVLSQTYAKIGIILSKQMQKQITSGNFEEFKRFLLEIQRKMAPKKTEKPQAPKQEQIDGLDFNKIEKYKSYQQCQNVLEAIVKMISKECGLTTKQAFSTLAQNLKYFSHMIVKGIKNSYDQIQTFFKCMIENMPHLMYLAQKDPANNTSLLLEIVKPSLISRQPQVALCGSHTLSAVVYESSKYNGKNLVYQILSHQQSGFDFIYMGIKRHPHLIAEYMSFIHPLIQNSYKQFFELHLKNIINNEAQYIKTIIILLEGVRQSQESRKSVVESGMLKNWVKMCEESFNVQANNRKDYPSGGSTTAEQAKILSLQLMCDLWKMFSAELDQQQAEQLLMRGIEELKKNTRKDNYLIKVSAFNRLFDFLDYLAQQKNRLAAIVYKKTIFLLFENHEDFQLRQVILQNFVIILKKFPTIPVEFLLEPLLRQLIKEEGVSYILNVFDFEFFIQIFKHPKIEAEYALNYLEYFTKLYTKNIIYSGVVIRIIELLCARFCEEETIMEYIIKNVQSSLNVYGMLALGKKTSLKGREEKLMNSQKKSLVIELLKYYIKLQNQLINDSIKQRVLRLYINWIDTKNHNDKGLYYLLTMFGDVNEMIMKERIQKQNNPRITQQSNSPNINSTSRSPKYPSERQRIMPNSASNSTPKLFSPFLDSPQTQKKTNYQRTRNGQEYDIWREDSYIQPSQYNYEHTSLKQSKEYKKQSQRSIKPQTVDSRTLDDIENYKQRKRRESQKKRELIERSNEPQTIPKVNQTELIQRQISLGYNKILKPEQLIYELDSVKTKYLKEDTEMIELEELEERDVLSTNTVFRRYEKQIQTLFYKYTAVGSVNNRSPTQQKVFMSFTDLNRMLKEKNLNKLPKIVINEIITFINRRKKYNMNVLVGVEEKQFTQFLILFTNLYLKEDKMNKDQPFGYKIQKVLLKFFDGEWFSKEINDRKASEWFRENRVDQLAYEEQQTIRIPQGYKKIVNEEAIQAYVIPCALEFNIPESYQTCLQVLNEIFKEKLQFDIFPAITETKKIIRIVPTTKAPKPKIPQIMTRKASKIPQVLTQKRLRKSFEKTPQEQSTLELQAPAGQQQAEGVGIFKANLRSKKESLVKMTIGRSRSHKDINKKVNQTEMLNSDEIIKKHKQQQEYAKKLRDELQAIKKIKQKKNQEQKLEKEQQEKEKLKKQDKHKKYLQQNKKKIQEKKEKEEQQMKLVQTKQKEQKEKRKQELKQKQKSLLQKMQKQIQQKKQKFDQKLKSKQKHLKKLQNIEKKAKNMISQLQKSPNEEKQKQKRLNQQIASGSLLMPIVNKNEQQVKVLFEEYWNWKTKKLELKEIALMMKNFKISPEYLSPKLISETFKVHGKGDSLSMDDFKQLLVKYCYKSQKLKDQVKTNTGKQYEPQLLRNFLEEKLCMKAFNYVDTIKKAKLQQL